MKTIKLSGNANANLYIITYRDPNPEQAQKVVQSLLAIFVESSLGDKKQDTADGGEVPRRPDQALRGAAARRRRIG